MRLRYTVRAVWVHGVVPSLPIELENGVRRRPGFPVSGPHLFLDPQGPVRGAHGVPQSNTLIGADQILRPEPWLDRLLRFLATRGWPDFALQPLARPWE